MRLILLFIFLPTFLFAQGRLVIENNISRNKDSLILYTGLENHLEMYIMNSAVDTALYRRIDIREGDYSIKRQEYNGNATNVRLSVESSGPLSLKLRIGGMDTTIIAYCRRVPTVVYAALTRSNDSVYTKKQLNGFLGINVFTEDENFRYKYVVTSYGLSVSTDYGEATLNTQYGPYFSKHVKKLFKDCKKGSRLYFHDIVATCPDCRQRRLKDFSIRVL